MGRPKPNTNKPAVSGTAYGGRGHAANSTGSPAAPYPPLEVHSVPQQCTTESVEPQHYATEPVAPQHYDEPDEPQHYATEPVQPQQYATEPVEPHHATEPVELHYATDPTAPQHDATDPVESQPAPYPPPVQPAEANVGAPQYYNLAPEETQPVHYPPPPASPLRPAVVGTPVEFPPPAGQTYKNEFPAYAETDVAEQWSSELSNCDMSQDYAIVTVICPCVTFGQIAEIVDEGQTSCLLAGVLYMIMIPALFTCSVLSSGYRQKLREKYNLVEAPYDDCSVHLVNPCCALCQEYRELQKRGFDPSLGWIANLAQQQQNTSMAPPRNQFMGR